MSALSIHLQAAMGLGLLLYGCIVLLVFVVFPAVWIVSTVNVIKKKKEMGTALGRHTVVYAVLKGFIVAAFLVFLIGLALFLFVYFFVDLSIS